MEESFQSGEGLTGLDEHQVRRWRSWRRWTVLAMLAHAILTVIAATTPDPEPTTEQHGNGLIRLTCNEVQRLTTTLITSRRRTIMHTLHWSQRRRHTQARVRASHYHRQATRPT